MDGQKRWRQIQRKKELLTSSFDRQGEKKGVWKVI